MINDIKAAARSLDQQNLTQFGGALRSLTSSGANLLAMVNQIADALGRMNYTLQSVRASDYGTKLASDFSKVRDMVRETRAELAGLNTGLREAVTLAGRMGTAAQRVRSTRAAPAAGGGAPAAEAGAAPMSTALVVRQDSQYLAMAQERARMMAQVSAVEEAERRKQLAAQVEMAAQVQAFQQARVAAATTTATAESMAAIQGVQARIAAERAAQAAFTETQEIRKRQIAEVADYEAMKYEEETQNAGEMYMRLRAFQNAHVQAVQNAARQEMEAVERTLQARLRAAEQWRAVSRQQLALPPGRTDAEGAAMFAGRAFDALGRPQRLQIPERAGPSAFAEGAFAPSGIRPERVFGGFEEVNRTLEKTSGALKNTKEHKDRLDKNLKDTAQNTLPKFNAAWAVTIGYFALFTTRRIIGELEDLGKSLFETGVEFEKAFALMKAGAGDSAEEGARRMQVAADLARKLGLDLSQLVVDYGKVAAASKGTDIEGRQTEEMIKNLGSAMAVLGQHTEKGSGIIKVFTDVLSKGRLQSEELVKQLGNAVPGAFRVVAQSLGMTTTQLQDAVAKGSVSATQTLVKLAAELNRIYGAQALENLNRLGGAFNGLKQSLTEVALLIVNMNTGIMQGGGGTFGKALVDSFKQLSDLLQDRTIQTHIVELANFITSLLAKAFQGLISVMQVAIEHLWGVIFALTILAGATITAGIIALVGALQKLFATIIAFATSRGGLLILLVGMAASFLAASYMADQFEKSIEGLGKSMDKVFTERERLRGLAAPGNQNPGDQTRAVQEALNRVEAEQRRFVEGVRQEAQMLELSAAGVSTLSAKYEAYLNVLERIKSQEVKDLFAILSPQDAATMKRRLTEALLAAELVKQAIGDIVGMFKSLDQAQEQFATQAATATANLQAMQQGTFTELGSRIQEQYDQKVIPVMRRVREELRSIADPNLRNTLVGAFNAWSAAMRDNIVHIEKLKDLMAGVTDITTKLRDFRFTSMLTDMTATVRAGEGFVDTTLDNTQAVIDTMRKEGFFPDLQPPKIRTLGDELKEGFNPTEVGKEMGHSFTDIFVVAMEASVQKLIDQMKAMADVTRPAMSGKLQEFPGTAASALEQSGKYKEFFIKYGKEYDVDPELAARIAKNESNFDALATAFDKQGRIAGQGIMQIIPSTQRELGVTRPYDPEESIKFGIKYIRQRIDQAKGDVEGGLAGYRGASRAGDPGYFERVLGGYKTTTEGRFPAAGAQPTAAVAQAPGTTPTTAATPPAATTPATTAAEAKQKSMWEHAWDTLFASERNKAQMDWLGKTISGVTGGAAAGDERFAADVDAARRKRGEIIPRSGEMVDYPRPLPPVPPEPTSVVEARLKALDEENKRTKEGMDAIRKRTQAQMDADAAGAKATKEMEERAAREKALADEGQKLLDQRTAQLSKEIELLTQVGKVEMSNESIDARARAGLQALYEHKKRYNAATDEQLKQALVLGQAQFTKDAIAQGNAYALSLEKQTKALNDETKALRENREESSLTKDASAAARQRERERLEGGRAFDPAALARYDKATAELTKAQVGSSVETYLSGSAKEVKALQMEIDSYKDNTIVRAANLQARREEADLVAMGDKLNATQKAQIREDIEAKKRLRIELQMANGPLRQYIDSLADFSDQAGISNAIQERSAELFKGLEDNIINFTKTGKLNFRELADSFIESIIRMTLQALIFRPIAEALNKALSPGGGGGGAAPAAPAAGGGAGWFGILQGLVKIGGMIGGIGGAPTMPTSGTLPTTWEAYRALPTPSYAPFGATGGWVTTHGIQLFQGGGMAGMGSDTVPAMLTPGEMVLNKEQQANVFGKKDGQQNNTFNMVFPNVSNEDQARKTAAQAYSEISSRLERQRVRDGVRTKR